MAPGRALRAARWTAGAAAAAVAAIALVGCSVSITANGAPTPTDTAGASMDASQSAAVTEDFAYFCAQEAKGALDFIAIAGADGVKDGIASSIKEQQLTGAQADACVKSWVKTLASYGYTYDPVANTITGSQTATPSPDDTSMPSEAASPVAS